MKSQEPDDRVRPTFVALLVCLMAVIAIPIWLAARSRPAAVAPAAAPVAAAQTVPKPHRVWHRVTSAPRGSPTSVRAASQPPLRVPPIPKANAPSLEERWGIRLDDARLTMGNAFLDLRYDVVDPAKAASLANANFQAYILDRATGAKLFMPAPPKEGCFPPTGNRLEPGIVYSAMIGNSRGVLKSGSQTSLIVGDSLTTNVVVD